MRGLPLLLFSTGLAWAADPACPPGQVPNEDPYETARCVSPGSQGGSVLKDTGFTVRPKCPPGSIPVRTAGMLQRYRCVSRPGADPGLGRDNAATAPVLPSIAPAAPAAASARPAAAPAVPKPVTSFQRYTPGGELELDLPKDWRVADGWSDDVPTLYAELESARKGKPVTLVVSKYLMGREGYLELDEAIAQERKWQHAVATGEGRVAGLPARFTYVPKESRTAYVALATGGYYTVSYSAPEDLFVLYEPAYQRLLRSMRLLGRRRPAAEPGE